MDINEKIIKAKQALAFRGRGESGREVDEIMVILEFLLDSI